jgi:hypothetical protein
MSNHVARHARRPDSAGLPPYPPVADPAVPPAHAVADPAVPPAHAAPQRRDRRLFVVLGIVGALAVAAVAAAIATTSTGGSSIDYGTSAATIASRLRCTGSHPSPTATGDIDLGIHPREEILCNLDGEVIDISTWADRASQAHAESVAHTFVHSFGMEVYLASGTGWLAGLDDESDTPDVAAEKSVAKTVAMRLRGAVVHWN